MRVTYNFDIGYKFNDWTVIDVIKTYSSKNKYSTKFVIQCKCGTTYSKGGWDVKHMIDVGVRFCKNCDNEWRKTGYCGEHNPNFKDFRSSDQLYTVYHSMRNRCYNPHDDFYKNYGGRGITICKEWQDFAPFRDWAYSHGYYEGCNLQIDRINNDKGYGPENCRFVSCKINCNNRSSNRFITFNGKTQTVSQWAEETGLVASTIYARLNKGWPPEKILAPPIAQTRSNESDEQNQ